MNATTASRQRLIVRGVVQGVGFRPFVYSLATQLGLSGFVGNDSDGVFIEVEGSATALATFAQQLCSSPPPLAYIEQVTITVLPRQGSRDFVIVPSATQLGAHTLIAPDLNLCDACRQELFDPHNRRYRYPFINCTHCGPRFTIIRELPYDRPLTTMAAFAMCPQCQAEYDEPHNRRFHAQPNACPICGPQLVLAPITQLPNHPELLCASPITAAQQLLHAGLILAIKGIGGFHLACDATHDQAVQMLRQRKGRVDKPFALMVADLATAHQLAHINDTEAALLTSRQRPIVLLRQRADSAISPWVAPGNPDLGVLLPYSPLHELLFHVDMPDTETRRHADREIKVLVMTSANYSDEPIVKENDEAQERLAGLADALLLHNREIHVHCDDSVVRVVGRQELPLRRSRGYAPFPVRLPFPVRPILAVGGEIKATFCLTTGDHAFLSQHIGDMANLETLTAFARAVDHFQQLFRVEPEILACDQHPGYLSARWAEERAQGRKLLRVQHHHAHIAALMAEHGLLPQQALIGVSFDGTGYGPDGAIWGGEVLVATYGAFTRRAHLRYIPLPGGDAAIKHPYRTALAHLWAAGVTWSPDLAPVAASTPTERNVIQRQLASGFHTVPTSSMGRLFDAVAALLGVRQSVTYEGQAAIELEALIDPTVSTAYTLAVAADGSTFDAAPLIQALVQDLRQGVARGVIAAKFHNGVAEVIARLCQRISQETGLTQVGLSGGVFQNGWLLERLQGDLTTVGLTVLTHRLVPPNDGGLALGQAVIAQHVVQ